jgi:hypothetical protein
MAGGERPSTGEDRFRRFMAALREIHGPPPIGRDNKLCRPSIREEPSGAAQTSIFRPIPARSAPNESGLC